MGEVFGIMDKVIVAVVVIAVLGTVAMIAYVIINSELEEKEHTKKIKEDAELRKKRLEKIPVEARKCSNCQYGKKVILSDMTVYECSNPDIWDNHVIEENHIGCQAFDPLLASFIDRE